MYEASYEWCLRTTSPTRIVCCSYLAFVMYLVRCKIWPIRLAGHEWSLVRMYKYYCANHWMAEMYVVKIPLNILPPSFTVYVCHITYDLASLIKPLVDSGGVTHSKIARWCFAHAYMSADHNHGPWASLGKHSWECATPPEIHLTENRKYSLASFPGLHA